MSGNTLWIGDIENWMDEKFVRSLFSSITSLEVKSVKIMRDKNTGQNMGYGFVEFENSNQATFVLNSMNGKQIEGTNKFLKLNWAQHNTNKNNIMGLGEVQIYIGDIDVNVSDDLLKESFLKYYSSVSSAKVIIDPKTRVSKGYGFVKFKDANEANRAMNEMNGRYILNKPIKCK